MTDEELAEQIKRVERELEEVKRERDAELADGGAAPTGGSIVVGLQVHSDEPATLPTSICVEDLQASDHDGGDEDVDTYDDLVAEGPWEHLQISVETPRWTCASTPRRRSVARVVALPGPCRAGCSPAPTSQTPPASTSVAVGLGNAPRPHDEPRRTVEQCDSLGPLLDFPPHCTEELESGAGPHGSQRHAVSQPTYAEVASETADRDPALFLLICTPRSSSSSPSSSSVACPQDCERESTEAPHSETESAAIETLKRRTRLACFCLPRWCPGRGQEREPRAKSDTKGRIEAVGVSASLSSERKSTWPGVHHADDEAVGVSASLSSERKSTWPGVHQQHKPISLWQAPQSPCLLSASSKQRPDQTPSAKHAPGKTNRDDLREQRRRQRRRRQQDELVRQQLLREQEEREHGVCTQQQEVLNGEAPIQSEASAAASTQQISPLEAARLFIMHEDKRSKNEKARAARRLRSDCAYTGERREGEGCTMANKCCDNPRSTI